MKQHHIMIVALLISCLVSPVIHAHAQTELPVVRAVLFYSPTCGHCEYVINETILPMIDKYGEQLQIIGVDVSQQHSQALFLAAIQKFDLERVGVPFLVIDDLYLVGSADIPEKFPALVDTYLAQGGLDWPEIPGLAEALGESQNTPEPTLTPVPVVHAVLFYRSACSHCRKVTEEVIHPLIEKYGAQLEIFGIDVSSPEGHALYDTAIERFKIERFGVPTLILGDQVLVGATEIEERFAGITEQHFVQGGLDWPDITGLREAIAKASEAEPLTPTASAQSGMLQTTPGTATVAPTSVSPIATPGITLSHSRNTTWKDNFTRDLAGNTLAVLVLTGMLASVVWTAAIFQKTYGASLKGEWARIIPVLCALGFGVAGYLAYVETTQVTAVCGPVGDCNTVQQSEFARLFGILPIGLLGLAGYVAIFIAWLVGRYAREQFAGLAVMSLFAMTVIGTLFSIYLTFLEPFVIGATCAWCLTSAVLMTVLMLLSMAPAKLAVDEMNNRK